jgi:hypothetical protein
VVVGYCKFKTQTSVHVLAKFLQGTKHQYNNGLKVCGMAIYVVPIAKVILGLIDVWTRAEPRLCNWK